MLACAPHTVDAYRAIRCIAAALESVSTTSSQPTAALSTFQSSSVPQIPLADYAVHIAARCSHGEEAVLLGLVLMARYCRTVNQMPTAYTEHRLLLAAIVVGSKAHYDDFYKNVYMARIGGVGTKELAQLELHFIMNIKGSLVVSPREMARFRSTFEGLGAAITDATTPEAKASARSQAQRLGTYLMLEEVTAAHDYSSIVSAKVIKTAITPLNQAQACGAVGDAMGPASQSSPLVTRCSSSTVPIKLRTLVAELSVSDNLAVGSSVTPLFASSSLARSGAFD